MLIKIIFVFSLGVFYIFTEFIENFTQNPDVFSIIGFIWGVVTCFIMDITE
jgi:hypothetical protein